MKTAFADLTFLGKLYSVSCLFAALVIALALAGAAEFFFAGLNIDEAIAPMFFASAFAIYCALFRLGLRFFERRLVLSEEERTKDRIDVLGTALIGFVVGAILTELVSPNYVKGTHPYVALGGIIGIIAGPMLTLIVSKCATLRKRRQESASKAEE